MKRKPKRKVKIISGKMWFEKGICEMNNIEPLIVPIGMKESKIYRKTKNRRIKEKQKKKCPMIEVYNIIAQRFPKKISWETEISIGENKIQMEE